jgi:hypothetical protein
VWLSITAVFFPVGFAHPRGRRSAYNGESLLQGWIHRNGLLTNISNVHDIGFYGQYPTPDASSRETRPTHWLPYDLWSNHLKSAVVAAFSVT